MAEEEALGEGEAAGEVLVRVCRLKSSDRTGFTHDEGGTGGGAVESIVTDVLACADVLSFHFLVLELA